MFGVWWVWWLLAALVVGVVWFVYSAIQDAKTPEGQKRIQEYNERKQRILNPPEGFPREAAYLGKAGRIALDDRGKRLAIGIPEGWSVFDYCDIRGAELDIEGMQVTRTSSSRSLVGAAVGGLAFGPAGAVVGGLGGKTTSRTTKEIGQVTLKVHVRDMTAPIREVQFRHRSIHTAQWSDADTAVRHGNEWMSRIQLIVDESGA